MKNDEQGERIIPIEQDGEADNLNQVMKQGSLKQAIAAAVENILEPAAPRTFVFIKTLDGIDKKSLKEAVSFTRKCIEGPDCSSGDIIAVANTFPSKYFLEGMVFTEDGVFWEHRNYTYYIEYNDIEAALVPKSDSTVGFGDDIMLIERYSNDEIAIPFNRMLYNDYRAVGDLLLELNKIAAEYE